MEQKKTLNMRYSRKDMANLMGISYTTFRRELSINKGLKQRLANMEWRPYMHFRKPHVLEIFKSMGYPHGYEWYEQYQNGSRFFP